MIRQSPTVDFSDVISKCSDAACLFLAKHYRGTLGASNIFACGFSVKGWDSNIQSKTGPLKRDVNRKTAKFLSLY
jgi:hypothetical protein